MKLLFFKAPWCGACHAIESKVPAYAQHVDCEINPEIAEHYNISNLPTFVATDDNGEEVGKIQTTDMSALSKWYNILLTGG